MVEFRNGKCIQKISNKSSVIFHENVTQEQVATAIGGAEALLYPSTFEGFGIPILKECSQEFL